MVDPASLVIGGAVLVLLILSAFFSGSETALTATSRARMHQLEKDGVKGAKRVNQLIADRESLIGAILLGNNLVNILASSLTTALFLRLFGQYGIVLATVVMTALILIFAEVAPKTWAISNPDRAAMMVSGPIKIVRILFAPVVLGVETLIKGLFMLFGLHTKGPILSAHEEIRGAVNLLSKEGGVKKNDRDMIGGILDLQEMNVEDIMIHRKNMRIIDISQEPQAIVVEALESAFTRLPLFENDPENIVGVIHAKDLLKALHDKGGDFNAVDIRAIMRKPVFTPETTTLPEQLNAFRADHEHFALVVDEYGALMGLVTLEDILEEIVGQIEDEHDHPVRGLRRQGDGSVLVNGDVSVRDLNRAMEWDLPDEEAVTVAGLVIHESQTIPDVGQAFSYYGYRFEINGRKRNQITTLKIAPVG
jgi:magnesium and cobalt exporter, CNNM family